MTETEFYEACYDILVKEAEAPTSRKADFVRAFTQKPRTVEYRFGSIFGPWTYFYSNGFPPQVHHVRAPEEKDPKHLKVLERINAKIAELERAAK